VTRLAVIERCSTIWDEYDGFYHYCTLLAPHDADHECACGDRCEQLLPRANPKVNDR
jgi:hypothetical protein